MTFVPQGGARRRSMEIAASSADSGTLGRRRCFMPGVREVT